MKDKRLNVGVLFGGRSGEHEISLLSARAILGALDPHKYAVTQIGITHDGDWLIGEDVHAKMSAGLTPSNSESLLPAAMLPIPSMAGLYQIRQSQAGQMLEKLSDIDVVFPVLHGPFGEDGTLQGLLELAEIAYVGAGVVGSAVGMDKAICKDVLRANGIPQVDSILVLRRTIESDINDVVHQAEALSPYPLFTKPANLGSSVGIAKCTNRNELIAGLVDASRYDRRILVERGIDGREIEVSVLGNNDPIASVPGEIVPSREFYSYEAKYIDDRSELHIPAPISFELSQQVRDYAVRAYKAVDCAGMARIDFLLDRASGELYLNEINSIPGFTQISMYPKLWEASGLPFNELVDKLIELALERRKERDLTEWRFVRS